MITLTDTAIQKVQEVMASRSETDPVEGIRVAVVGGGCSGFQYAMNLEKGSKEGDRVVEVNGFKVFVDDDSLLYLEGTEIDYVETNRGAGFKFNNPNVGGTCGCGESFHT